MNRHGLFTPEGVKKEDYLMCYSKLFPTVELNFFYCQTPKAENMANKLVKAGKNLPFYI
jgi:uncharacterized protein YecE (DUF72 family)